MVCGRLMIKYLMLSVLALLAGCSPPPSDLGNFRYTANNVLQCPAGSLKGMPGRTDGERTTRGIQYIVRTPINYDATRTHPLIIVFSSGDRGAIGMEWFTGLTKPATSAGFIVAYADNRPRNVPSTYRPISKEWILELGTVASEVAKKWCIDADNIFYAGHSNGGTVSTALALMQTTQGSMSAIAPSATGFAASNFEEFSCPEPLPVMIMHSDTDELFSGYGRQAVEWWRQCNHCSPETIKLNNGCLAYQDCVDGGATNICIGNAHHTKWPQRAEDIVNFFNTVKKL